MKDCLMLCFQKGRISKLPKVKSLILFFIHVSSGVNSTSNCNGCNPLFNHCHNSEVICLLSLKITGVCQGPINIYIVYCHIRNNCTFWEHFLLEAVWWGLCEVAVLLSGHCREP